MVSTEAVNVNLNVRKSKDKVDVQKILDKYNDLEKKRMIH
jgi:hypothetical protein